MHTTTVPLEQTDSLYINKDLFKSSSVVLTVSWAYQHRLTKASLLQVMHLQITSKTATIQYKPVTSLAGDKNALGHYEQSRGYDQISHAFSNIHGLYGCSCNLFDVMSVYSLNQVIYQAVSPANGLGTSLYVNRQVTVPKE